MSNPARELMGIFETWESKGGSAPQSRHPETPEGIATMIRAMDLVSQLRRHLGHLSAQGLEVDVYLDASDQWARAIVAYPNGWVTNDAAATQNLNNKGRLDMLRGLSILLDGLPPTVNMGQLVGLRAFVDEIAALLAVDDSLDDALREYIFSLVNEVRRAMDQYESGAAFDASDAIRHLWVGLRAAESASKVHKRDWRAFANKVLPPATASILASIPTLAIEAIKLANGG